MEILENGGVTAPLGFKAAGVACNIKSSGKKDLAIVFSESPALVGAAFTGNAVVAAPVTLCRELLKKNSRFQAIVINSGNANACTGRQGAADAVSMSALTSRALKLDTDSLVASTGIIGEPLPMDKVRSGIEAAAAALSAEGGAAAAEAIMTTDAFRKETAVRIEIDGKPVTIGGMAKGAGMIAPKMTPHATMIAVIATDAAVEAEALNAATANGVKKTFNRCSVDGDTSTNDSVFLLANGAAGNKPIKINTEPFDAFSKAVNFVMTELAKMMVKDGEGATKLITYEITGAGNEAEAEKIGLHLANSLLIKTMFFGGDPNWGRVLAAAGASGALIDEGKTAVYLGSEAVAKSGQGVDFNEDRVKEILSMPEITLKFDAGVGNGSAVCYGCDLTYDYVRINAEYRT